MSDTIADILERAAARVERGWTQDAFARDTNGLECSVFSEHAIAWCLAGAVDAETSMRAAVFLEAIGAAIGMDAVTWNDAPGRTQAEVVTALREAARLAREREVKA